ncbi:MAG: HEAT repeat domain-containing protein [Candidatus Omnitrophica bacterium]|nr:HEAT repeat domain-containing protein [Candidatus Omnitrophota bacterium]
MKGSVVAYRKTFITKYTFLVVSVLLVGSGLVLFRSSPVERQIKKIRADRGEKEKAVAALIAMGPDAVAEIWEIWLPEKDDELTETLTHILVAIDGPAVEKLFLDYLNTPETHYFLRHIDQAAMAIGLLRVEEAVPVLLRDFKKKFHPGITAIYGQALVRIGDRYPVESWLALAENEDHAIRSTAIEALLTITDERAITYVTEYRHQWDQDLQASVIKTALANKPSYSKACERLLTHPQSAVRASAAELLSQLEWRPADDPQKIQYLAARQQWREFWSYGDAALERAKALTRDEDVKIRGDILKALATTIHLEPLSQINLSEALQEAKELGDTTFDERQEVWLKKYHKLESWQYDLISDLKRLMSDPDGDVRQQAAVTLKQMRWQPANEEETARYHVAIRDWYQCVMDGPSSLEPLLTVLKGDDEKLISGAAYALGKLGDRRAYLPLLDTARVSKKHWAHTKGETYYPQGVSAVIQKMEHNDALKEKAPVPTEELIARLKGETFWKVLAETAEELVRRNDPRGVEAILEIIKSTDDVNVVMHIARPLLTLGDKRVIPVLENYLERTYWRRSPVNWVLEGLTGKRSHEDLMAILLDKRLDGWSWYDVKNELIAKGAGRLEEYAALLTHPDEHVRERMAIVLGALKDPRAIDLLVEALPSLKMEALDLLENNFHWVAKSKMEKIHVLAVEERLGDLFNIHEEALKVLFYDMKSGSRARINLAFSVIISFGKEETIADLISVLNRHGNKYMLDVYLNCGKTELVAAARDWAERNGYNVMPGSPNAMVIWGSAK